MPVMSELCQVQEPGSNGFWNQDHTTLSGVPVLLTTFRSVFWAVLVPLFGILADLMSFFLEASPSHRTQVL